MINGAASSNAEEQLMKEPSTPRGGALQSMPARPVFDRKIERGSEAEQRHHVHRKQASPLAFSFGFRRCGP